MPWTPTDAQRDFLWTALLYFLFSIIILQCERTAWKSCIWSIIKQVKREQPLLKGKGWCAAGISSWGWVFPLLLSPAHSNMQFRNFAVPHNNTSQRELQVALHNLFLKTALPKSAFPWLSAHVAQTLFLLQSLILQIQKSFNSKYGFGSEERASWANAVLNRTQTPANM